jgi:type I restriction enzyme S subunit
MSVDSWQYIPFTKAAKIISDEGKRVKQRDYLPTGKVPVIDQGQEFIGGYVNDGNMLFKGGLPVIIFGDHTRNIKFVNRPFAVGAEGVKILKPDPSYEPKFFYYFLHTLDVPSRGYSRHLQFLRKFDVPLAPLDQQKLIVAEIEKQFSRLDEAVANIKRVKANLKRYKAAVLKAAVEGKLTEEWRKKKPGVEPASELLKRILAERKKKWEADHVKKYVEAHGHAPKDDSWKKKYKEPVSPDTSNLPELPKGWVWAMLEQMAEIGTGATPLRSKREYYDGGKVPWITSGALNKEFIPAADDYITDLAVQETNAKLFPAHTLLVAMYGEGKTRGKVSELLIDASTNQACAAIILEGLSAKTRGYIKVFFLKNYDDIRRLSSGGVQPNLNLSHIKGTVIPLPPIAEQQSIIAEVDRRLSLVREVTSQVDANLKRAERLRQSILISAFEGRLAKR